MYDMHELFSHPIDIFYIARKDCNDIKKVIEPYKPLFKSVKITNESILLNVGYSLDYCVSKFRIRNFYALLELYKVLYNKIVSSNPFIMHKREYLDDTYFTID